MVLESETVRFYLNTGVSSVVSYDLKKSRVSSIDSPDEKLLCPSRRHYGLILNSEAGYRKLYFLTYEQMQDGVRRIL